MFKLHCPKCGNSMNYQNYTGLIGKRKACVYCGKSFKVMENIIKKM
jgi:uncharacterized protein (DUF983 family)